MKNFDTRVYNISDFVEWESSGLLNMSPDFQRRSVWTESAKSYLIDTIVRGKPIPKILLTQQLKETRNVRVVVDGQQRLRTILSYIKDDFRISKAHNQEFAGKRYSQLPEEIKRDYLKYEVGVDLLFDVEYEDVLDIFARLNTYSVKLNPQEQLNAKYLGYFKQAAYRLGYRYVGYWLDAGVLTRAQITRMAEARLSSDLMVLLIGGVQTNKNIGQYYKKFEDEDSQDVVAAEENFDLVMTYIGEIYNTDDLKNTNFKRIHLFYSLFSAIAHGLFGLDGMDNEPRPNVNRSMIGRIRAAFDDISSKYDDVDLWDESLEKFVDYSRRATTDTGRRKFRAQYLCRKIIENQ